MGIRSRTSLLAGWGNFPRQNCISYRPEKQREVAQIQEAHPASLLARGCGRSYGDAALNPEGILLTERLNRFLSFDETHGILHAEAGVTLAEIIDTFATKGWFLPVVPGTRYVSLGGAFAANVHGKNHHRSGDFARHVRYVDIRTAEGTLLRCSPEKHADIFWASAGGMGMTGIIETLAVALKPITSLSLQAESKKTLSLFAMVEAFYEAQETHEYTVGWIDHTATGEALGRGVFEKAKHLDTSEGGTPLEHYQPPKPGLSVPSFFPSLLLNRYSMAAYNALRFVRFSAEWKKDVVSFNGFFHPLDGVQHWNRLYGKNGFFQYQCVIPEHPNVAEHLHQLLSFIQETGLFSFLAVLKYHGDHEGLLSFPMRGFSLALDFPNNTRTRQLQHMLNEKVAALGGRVYLAKDALLSPKIFERMYQNALPEWRRIITQLDPKQKIDSLMAQRLDFRGKHGT